MSWKVVRNEAGNVIAFGPNDDNYEPNSPYAVEIVEPSIESAPPTALEQIRALEAQYADAQARMTRQSLLVIALDKACTDPAASGLSRDEVHALLMTGDNGYAALFNLEAQITALRAPA